jgi:hypothetical protein
MTMTIKDFKRPYGDVKKVIGNYRNNKDIPFITNSATIPIDKLKDFIACVEILKGIESVKIYFCREEVGKHLVHKLDSNGTPVEYLKASDKLSQVSLLIVPHDSFRGEGKDIFETDDTILCMFPGGEGSGLCPPACGSGDI